MANFSHLLSELNAFGVPTGVLNRFTKLRHSKVKYKHIFYKASSPLSPSLLLKRPNREKHVELVQFTLLGS